MKVTNTTEMGILKRKNPPYVQKVKLSKKITNEYISDTILLQFIWTEEGLYPKYIHLLFFWTVLPFEHMVNFNTYLLRCCSLTYFDIWLKKPTFNMGI